MKKGDSRKGKKNHVVGLVFVRGLQFYKLHLRGPIRMSFADCNMGRVSAVGGGGIRFLVPFSRGRDLTGDERAVSKRALPGLRSGAFLLAKRENI